MRTFSVHIVSGLTALCWSVFAWGEDQKPAQAAKPLTVQSRSASGSDVLMPEFRSLDLDRDGFLSREEVARYPRAGAGQFEAADMDKNGKLDFEEFKVLHANTSQDRRLGSK